MPISCTLASLSNAAACYNGLSSRTMKGIKILTLCAWANGDSVDCDPELLAAEAACLTATLSDHEIEAVAVYLFCQIAQ